nr:pre-rRNA-processing protein TSR2 homolog [Tanacetum cinerariifolium]
MVKPSDRSLLCATKNSEVPGILKILCLASQPRKLKRVSECSFQGIVVFNFLGCEARQRIFRIPGTFEFFVAQKALYVDELENLLDDFMLSLNTEIDDGSIEEMADNLMIMHEECLEGNFASIERLRQSIPSPPLPVHVMGCEDDSDTTSSSGDESMEMGDDFDPASNMSEMAISEPPRAPAPAPTVDADGWTTVTSRRNRGSRH